MTYPRQWRGLAVRTRAEGGEVVLPVLWLVQANLPKL